jgi:hypothetical protein
LGAGRWSLIVRHSSLLFVVCVTLVTLVSLRDLISLTSNWHFADLDGLCFLKLRGKSKRF